MEEHFDTPYVPRSEPQKNNYTKVLWVIAALLLLVLASNVFIIVDSYYEKEKALEQQIEANKRYTEYKKTAQVIYDSVALYEEVFDDLYINYEKDAYNNPDVDRIAEQQLLAAEYQMIALSFMGRQNIRLIEMLTNLP